MGTISSVLSGYVTQINNIGGELAPMIVKAMVLLLILLFLTKYLGRFVAMVLIKVGIPERRAAHSVTGLHILILIVGALFVLRVVGFPADLLLRAMMIIIMVGLAVFVIAKPYIPKLPFEKGDIITADSTTGTVDTINLMHTCLKTFDGKMVFIPNHKVMNGQVINSSLRPNRHLDIDFFIPYDQNVEQVQKIVGEILKEDERVLKEPSPRVVIAQFSPNYLEMQARLWVLRKDALTSKWDLNAKIKSKFDEEGIKMAAPRLEVSQPQ